MVAVAAPVEGAWNEWSWLERSPSGGVLKGPANERVQVHLAQSSGGFWCVRAGNAFFSIRATGASPRKEGLNPLRALTSGTILALRFKAGRVAPAGEPLVLLRSLRRSIMHSAGRNSRVVSWEVEAGQRVETGMILGWVDINV